MPDPSVVERDLQALAVDLQRLEAEYNMFFGGRLPRPPWETRARVDAAFKRLDRASFESVALRFRHATLRARYTAFVDLWERGLRAREEGRPGPFARRAPASSGPAAVDRVVHVASFTDPREEPDKLHALYEAVMDARRESGDAVIAFHRFADLLGEQVRLLRSDGAPEVAFRVTVTPEGKVNLTARAVQGGT